MQGQPKAGQLRPVPQGRCVTRPASSPALSERPPRPAELEDWLNGRLYHPLSWRLAKRLARTRITPDMVSAAGALAIMLAAAAYGMLAWPWGVAVGMALHMGWHVLDGADGDLARLTGRSSAHGELVDGICDYLGHIVLYVTLGYFAAQQIGMMGWVLMWVAGASRVAQAARLPVSRRVCLLRPCNRRRSLRRQAKSGRAGFAALGQGDCIAEGRAAIGEPCAPSLSLALPASSAFISRNCCWRKAFAWSVMTG